MKTLIAAGVIALGAVFAVAPAIASAGPNDDELCSFNMAYRTMHKDLCADISVNSFGGGGAYDADGDGTPAASDHNDHDRNVK